MIFDTDVLIWAQRGNTKAISLLEKEASLEISIYTYMELLQTAHNKKQHTTIKDFLHTFNFSLLPITDSISHRALIYVEEYSLSNGIRAGDAIIAATAVEQSTQLFSGNVKHFKVIKELNLIPFKP